RAATPPAPQRQVAQPPQPQQVQPAPVAPETPGTLIAALPAREVPVPRAAPRPDANVGTNLLVASSPESQGQAPLAATAAPIAQGQQETPPASAMLAAVNNVPLPSRRPDHTPLEAETQVADAATAL